MKYNNNRVYAMDNDEFIRIILDSKNVSDALRNIGYLNPRAGRSRTTLMERITELNIDTTHFNGNCRMYTEQGKSIEEIFIKDSNRATGYLKRIIIKNNIMPYECRKCANKGMWEDELLSLHLDHVDGDNRNNLITNLRFLCPNCHSQTSTYAGKNRVKKIYICLDCGKEGISRKSKRCQPCATISVRNVPEVKKSRRKVERPSLDIIMKDISELGYTGTGKKYGVSDNAIRKWIK